MSRIGRTAETLHLGLDLGGTNIKCEVADGTRVLATDSCPTEASEGPEAVLARVAELGRATVARYVRALTLAELRRRACVAPEIPVVRAELGAYAGAVGAALWAAVRR